MGNTQQIKQNISKNINALSQALNSFDTPSPAVRDNPQRFVEDVKKLNDLLRFHCKSLGVDTSFTTDDISLGNSVKDSLLIRGRINVHSDIRPLGAQDNLTVYNIVASPDDVYKLLALMHNFETEESALKEKRKSWTPESANQNQCAICLDAKPELVLPCAHSYCGSCIDRYVIGLSEKKCPMCRRQFRESLSANMYEIVDDCSQDFNGQFRRLFFSILEARNRREVKKINKQLSIKEGHPSEQGHLDKQQAIEEQPNLEMKEGNIFAQDQDFHIAK